jgi:hypothetical protein
MYDDVVMCVMREGWRGSDGAMDCGWLFLACVYAAAVFCRRIEERVIHPCVPLSLLLLLFYPMRQYT